VIAALISAIREANVELAVVALIILVRLISAIILLKLLARKEDSKNA
jgi:hypothetical protein